jgi:nucleotide-binding universal stress UspA family protein
MLRSILVALDDTPGAQAARDVAIALARRTGARLTAAVVLDRPSTSRDHEPVPVGGAAFKARRDAKLTEQAEHEAQQALAACAAVAGDTPFEALRLEDAPEDALLKAGGTRDLIVIGRDCTLGREETEDDVAPVIEGLLRGGSRPLLVVPPGTRNQMPPGTRSQVVAGERSDGPVLAAYDGSQPSRNAFQLFALLGLAEGSQVQVAAVGESAAEAATLAGEGAALLRQHGLAAEPLGLTGSATPALLAKADEIGARLLVMGAFGGSSLMRLLAGSSTHTLLRDSRVPIFIHR